MKLREKVLVPLARSLVDEHGAANQPFDDAFVDVVAERLFRRHRSDQNSRVQERRFESIPNSEKGKYRKVVRQAIKRFQTSRS